MKKLAFLIILGMAAATNAQAAGEWEHPKEQRWPFQGPLGQVDRQSAQRGFQVYKEVCSACHSLKRVAFRNLTALGFSEAEVAALAAGYTVKDGPDDSGEMFDRPARPSDKFPGPYANDKAARASNGGALPPDLSLIVKARHQGPDYIYSLLTGYAETPADVKIPETLHYNPYFSLTQGIAMPPPLSDDRVTYEDGTAATVDQMARDVVNFLQWAAEPEMEHRKQMGLKVLLFLLLMTGVFWVAKKRVWKEIE